MSKLDELIKEYCPDGVEYVELNKICDFQNGFAFKSGKFKDQGWPILRITNINNGKLTDDGYIYFNEKDYKCDLNNYKVRPGGIVIAMSGATTGKIGFNYSENTYFLNQRVGLFKPHNKLNNRYLYHYLLSISKNILKISSGSGAQPNLSSVKMMEFKIPLPPLPVQEEIVRILDVFTELTAELTAELTEELTARKKQYEYYREMLIYNRSYISCTLDSIGEFIRGKRFIRTDIVKSGIPCMHYGDIYIKYGMVTDSTDTFLNIDKTQNMRYADKGDIIIVQAGENEFDLGVGVVWESEQKVAVHDACYIFKSKQNSRYISHYLRTYPYHKHLLKYVSNGKISSVNSIGIGKMLIPLPSLEEQQRIVDILDRFDTLCNDISEGLPAEIKMREHQYEYYRDKLLNFKNINDL